MVRPAGSFFSRSASFAVVGLASLRRASWTWMVPVGEFHLAPLILILRAFEGYLHGQKVLGIKADVDLAQMHQRLNHQAGFHQ